MGEKRNEYFDIKIQTALSDYMNIKVMMMGLNRDKFKNKLVHPIRLNKIAQSESGTNFYNERFGSEIEDKYDLEFKQNLPITACKEITEMRTESMNLQGCVYWVNPMEAKLKMSSHCIQ